MKVQQLLEYTDKDSETLFRHGDRVIMKRTGDRGVIKNATGSTVVDVLFDGKKKNVTVTIGVLEKE